MSKFSGSQSAQAVPSTHTGVQTTPVKTNTFNGGEAWVRDAKSDLFLLAVTNMVGEDTFYETGADRDARFEALVHAVTQDDPEWMQKFVPWLRNSAFMRSASIVMAAEYVAAGGPNGRQVVASAIKRADEPAEMIGYWLAKHGRRIPMAIKRGVADAVKTRYNEYNTLKYDGQGHSVRFADVLNLVHPKPSDDKQKMLFAHIMERRYGNFEGFGDQVETFPILSSAYQLDGMTEDQLLAELASRGSEALEEAGYTWERLLGRLPNHKTTAWEALIPKMGYMALLRNLRNFDEAGISKAARETVIKRLADPEEVAQSMQFPFRFWSAFKAVQSEHYKPALEEALNLSCQNIPSFGGKTLVLVDVSGSMTSSRPSQKSTICASEIAGVFGAAVALKGNDVTLVKFGNSSKAISVPKGGSFLSLASKIRSNDGLGHGTEMWGAIDAHLDGHDRIVVMSDMQTTDSEGNIGLHTGFKKSDIKIFHGFNLGGHAPAVTAVGKKGRYEYGGFSDATFRLMPILESTGHARWPWE